MEKLEIFLKYLIIGVLVLTTILLIKYRDTGDRII